MSKFNGPWLFYYSENQAETAKELAEKQGNKPIKTFVYLDAIDGLSKERQYTECIYDYAERPGNYTPHEERFEDSEFIGRIIDPITKKKRGNNGQEAQNKSLYRLQTL